MKVNGTVTMSLEEFDANNSDRVRSLGAGNYTLNADTPNFFGTTARYTFIDGTSFDTSYPSGGDYIIIDHLFSLIIKIKGNTQK